MEPKDQIPQEQPVSPEGSIAYRKIGPQDWEKFRDIRLKALQTDQQAFGVSFENESKEEESHWKNLLNDAEKPIFVAEEKDAFVATVRIGKYADGSTLSAIYTDPAFRGRGISQELIKRALDEAKRKGVEKVRLFVNVDQEAAVGLYKKLGFEIIETMKQKMGDGLLHDEYVMDKIL